MKRILLSILIVGSLLLSACGSPSESPPFPPPSTQPTEETSPEAEATPAPSTEQPTPATHALSVSISPPEAGSVSNPSGDYEEGLQISLKATPSSGYQFGFWSGDVSGTSPTIMIIMDSNKKVTANFEKVRYSLSTSVNHVGSGIVSPSDGDFDVGTEVTLTATPSSGYRFVSWSGDVSGTSPVITITMDSNKNVTANFEKNRYSLSTSISPQGSGSVSPTGGTYDSDAQVTLTATPLSDYQFASWSGDISGTVSTITITMDSNKSVTANFARQSVWVTPMNATASGYTQWGGTWYTGPPNLAIDGNEITAWTLNGMGEITFDLGSAKLIGGIEAYWAGSVTNGNTVNVYVDGVQVLTNEKFGATKNTRYFTPIRGRLVKYQTVALPHNELLQVAGWSEVAEFKIFVQGE